MIRYFKINELALNEIFDLLERGYHEAYTTDNGEYLTICLTDDNGHMRDGEITDRFFDLEYTDTGVLQKFLKKKELKDVAELIRYVDYLEDIKKDYEWLKSQVLKTANAIKNLY